MKRVLTFVLIYILAFLPAVGKVLLGIDKFSSPLGLLLWLLPMPLFFVGANWLGRRAGYGGLGGMGLALRRGAGRNLALGVLAGAVHVLVILGITLATGRLRVTAVHADRVLPLLGPLVFAFAWTACSEELLYRSALLRALPRMQPVWLVVITSLLFAAGHLYAAGWQPLTLLFQALGGAIYAIAALTTGSLWFPIGMHWAFNVLNPLLIENRWVLAGTWSWSIWPYIAGALIMLALLPLLLRPAAGDGAPTEKAEAA